MSRKFRGKCFFYSSRVVPDRAMVYIELSGLDGCTVEKNKPTVRTYEPGKAMRVRNESGYHGEHRAGESISSRQLMGHCSAVRGSTDSARSRVNEHQNT